MTEDQVIAAVRTKFETEWAALGHSAVPVFWPNEMKTLPDSGPFAHVEVSFGAHATVGLGGSSNNRYRQSGEVIIRLFDDSVKPTVGAGETVMGALVKDAAAIFRGHLDNDLHCYSSGPQGVGALDGNYFQRDVVARFTFDLIG